MIFNPSPTFVSSAALVLAAVIGLLGLASRAAGAFWPQHRRHTGSMAYAAGLAGCALLLGGIILELSSRLVNTGTLSASIPSPVTHDLLGGSPFLVCLVFFFAFENAFYFVKSIGRKPKVFGKP